MRKSISISTAMALGLGLGAAAQAQTVRELNDNVTKVEANSGDIRARGMSNPAQDKARAQIPGTAKIQVHAKDSPTSQVPNPNDLEVETRVLNENVTKVDGTVGDFRVKGIATPGTTNVKVQDPGQIKVQVQAKDPK